MEFTNNVILVAGTIVLFSILASAVSVRMGMPLLLVFLVLGMLLGEEGPGGIHFESVQLAHLFGTVALAVILLDGGMRTQAKNFRVGLKPALGLATLGVVITTLVTGLAAAWLLNMSWLEGLLLGAIVGSTDAAAVFSVLHSRGLELKQRVAATLEIESGANDPMAIFMTVVLVEVLAQGQPLTATVSVAFIMQMGLGVFLGLGGGWLLAQLINRLTLTSGLYPLAILAGGLALYGVTADLGGSGFLAIYLAGLLLGNRPLQNGHNIRRFHDALAWLGQIIMFLMLGLLVTPSELLPLAPQALLIAAVLILIARPIAVGLCLLPFHFPWRDQLFIGWIGLRGAVPIILALFPLLAGLAQAHDIFNVVFFVVLISLVVQGWTVALAARALRLEVPPLHSSIIQRVELDIPGQANLELVGYRLSEQSPILAVRREGRRVAPQAHLVAVLRKGELMVSPDFEQLQSGDNVYLLAAQDELDYLDQFFVPVQMPERLRTPQFFGEFTFNGQAQMASLGALYGLELPPEVEGLTVAEYLSTQLHTAPVVGDRIRIGAVELVVQEMEDGRVTKVGFKLPRGAENRDL
jgi:potassium/hydrogen antiporter